MTDIYCYQGNELDETTDDELLKYAFSTVGHELGFIEVDAEFASFKDFKSTWKDLEHQQVPDIRLFSWCRTDHSVRFFKILVL